MIKKLLKFLFTDNILKKDIDFLKKIVLFRDISERCLAKLALIVFKKTYLAGEKIYEIYHEANVVYIIKSGQVKLSAVSGGKIVEAENFFGEISLIGNRKHNCSAVALKDSELYLIYRSKFDDMSSSNNKAGLIVMRNLASIFAKRLKYSEI
ncbi:MAG: cyclic nucleotide-binding domain-containing protein [Endomicrobium sp.]|jgi:CRP-like cAMP-binding protein|nr:cyclic nucleotide-binding domain-containing protein [Endomicrobium sp.]